MVLSQQIQADPKGNRGIRWFPILGGFGIVPDVVFEPDGEVFVDFDTDALISIQTHRIVPPDIPRAGMIMPQLQVSSQKFQVPAGLPRKSRNDGAWFTREVLIHHRRTCRDR